MEKHYISSGKQCRMKIGLSTQDYAQILFIFILQVYIRCLQSVQCFSFPNRTNVTSRSLICDPTSEGKVFYHPWSDQKTVLRALPF